MARNFLTMDEMAPWRMSLPSLTTKSRRSLSRSSDHQSAISSSLEPTNQVTEASESLICFSSARFWTDRSKTWDWSDISLSASARVVMVVLSSSGVGLRLAMQKARLMQGGPWGRASISGRDSVLRTGSDPMGLSYYSIHIENIQYVSARPLACPRST